MIHIGDVLKTLTIDDFLSHVKDGLYYELLEKVPGFDKLSMDRQGEIVNKIWQTFVVEK